MDAIKLFTEQICQVADVGDEKKLQLQELVENYTISIMRVVIAAVLAELGRN